MGLIINPRQIIKDGITSLRDVWSSSKVSTELSGKQATLVSGTNIKTINNTSLLGSGDITISGGGDIPQINMTATTATLDPNKFYVWGEVASLDISLAPETAGIENVYKFQFQSGAIATTLTLPSSVSIDGDYPNAIKTTYIVSIESNIAKIERKRKEALLPAAYKQVEYLQSTGTQYIALPVNTTTGVESLKVRFELTGSENNMVFGRWQGNYGDGVNIDVLNNNIRVWLFSPESAYTPQQLLGQHELIYNNGKVYDNDDEVMALIQGSTWNIGILPLFALAIGSSFPSNYGKIRISEFYIKTNVSELHLYSCYRISDNIAGMYDIANDVFYTNAGTGTFIIGQDI